MQPSDAIRTTLAAERFSVGGVVGRTFSTWARNFVPFVVLSFITNAPYFAFLFWTRYTGFASGRHVQRHMGAGAGFVPTLVGVAGIVGLLTVVLMIVQTGALTYGAIQHLAGRKVTLGGLIGTGLRRSGSVFVTGFIAVLVVLAGMLLLVIPGIIAACALVASVPAVVAEPIGASDAVKRSFALTRGRRAAVLGACLVMMLAIWGLTAGGALIGGVVTALAVMAFGPQAAPFAAGVALLFIAIAEPLGTLLPAVVYHDLRVEKEGVDTAELAKVFE